VKILSGAFRMQRCKEQVGTLYSSTDYTFSNMFTSVKSFTSRTSFYSMNAFLKILPSTSHRLWNGYSVLAAYNSPEFNITKLQCKYPYSFPTDEFLLEVKY
jgi:hypothetical protein